MKGASRKELVFVLGFKNCALAVSVQLQPNIDFYGPPWKPHRAFNDNRGDDLGMFVQSMLNKCFM